LSNPDTDSEAIEFGLQARECFRSSDWRGYLEDLDEQPEQGILIAMSLADEKRLTLRACYYLGDAAREVCSQYGGVDLADVTAKALPEELFIWEELEPLQDPLRKICGEIDVMTDWLTDVSDVGELLHYDPETLNDLEEGHYHDWANGVFMCPDSISFLGENGLLTARRAQMVNMELINLDALAVADLYQLYPKLQRVFAAHIKYWKEGNGLLDLQYLARIQSDGLLLWLIP